VKVTGYVADVYVCPPEIKNCKGDNCKNCEKPHFWLGDTADAKYDKSLIVSDYIDPNDKSGLMPNTPPEDMPPLFDAPKNKGKQIVLDATYDKSSEAGFKSSDGVLSFKSATVVGGDTTAQH
jgi:hypothetical protein